MSIQGSMNRGINIASFLYQQTPEYESRQNLKKIKSVTRRLDEQASELPEGLNALSENQLALAKDPRRDLTTEEGLSKYVNDATTLSNIYEDTLKQAEDLTERFMQLRGELKGGKLTDKQEKELADMHHKFADSLVTTRNMRYEFDKHTNEFNDAIGSTMSKIREREEDERNGVEHISPSPINKENKPVKENLSTTEEEDTPVQESYETSPAKEDLSPAGKEVQRILAEDRAAESVMRAQQRQQRHAYMMDRARKMLNNQYDSGEINPYEWDTAMTENGLWGGK